MNLKKIIYYLGIVLCCVTPISVGISLLIGFDALPLWLLILSDVCRICSLEVDVADIKQTIRKNNKEE